LEKDKNANLVESGLIKIKIHNFKKYLYVVAQTVRGHLQVNFACTLLYVGRFRLTWPVTLRHQSLCSLVPAYLQFMSSHHSTFDERKS